MAEGEKGGRESQGSPMRLALLLLLLPACGGAAFSVPEQDSGPQVDSPAQAEAGQQDVVLAPDAGMAVDAQDAASGQEAAATCTPFTNVYSCGMTSTTIYAPSELCQIPPDGSEIGNTMLVPDKCRCQETYTCECLQAHMILCDGGCSQPYPNTLLLRCY